mmetsp:Transcript_69071/g.152827  ORF Transcript_69071/g.152827 Transcript_69071/m.152827 type:complete len:221 (+) Transcript_69071:149-811(+)
MLLGLGAQPSVCKRNVDLSRPLQNVLIADQHAPVRMIDAVVQIGARVRIPKLRHIGAHGASKIHWLEEIGEFFETIALVVHVIVPLGFQHVLDNATLNHRTIVEVIARGVFPLRFLEVVSGLFQALEPEQRIFHDHDHECVCLVVGKHERFVPDMVLPKIVRAGVPSTEVFLVHHIDIEAGFQLLREEVCASGERAAHQGAAKVSLSHRFSGGSELVVPE